VEVLSCPAQRGFTLIEIMIVVAIMLTIMGLSVPFARQALHKEALNKAISDIVEICSNARARAIMQGSMTEVVVHAEDPLRIEVAGATGGDTHGGPPPSTSGLATHLDNKIGVAAIWVNGANCRDAEQARIRFYPNGTCDELRLVLMRPDNGDSRGLFLEVTTGLATIESDRFKLQSEIPR